jgi:hypothetical protein
MRLTLIIVAIFLLAGASPAQDSPVPPSEPPETAEVKQDILTLSKDKWTWMAERKVDALEALFHEEAVFVHMGGAMSRAQELDVIKSGRIQYKNADIQEASVRVIGTTAIVLNSRSCRQAAPSMMKIAFFCVDCW